MTKAYILVLMLTMTLLPGFVLAQAAGPDFLPDTLENRTYNERLERKLSRAAGNLIDDLPVSAGRPLLAASTEAGAHHWSLVDFPVASKRFWNRLGNLLVLFQIFQGSNGLINSTTPDLGSIFILDQLFR